VRNVPDNQEVFADVNTDQSIIVEILQFVHQVTNDDAARYAVKCIKNDNNLLFISYFFFIDIILILLLLIIMQKILTIYTKLLN